MRRIMASKKPFDILAGDNAVKIDFGSGKAGDAQFSMAEIAQILRILIVYGAVLGIIGAAIAMLFIHRDQRLMGEYKQDIMHKLGMVFLACSAVTLFNFLKLFLDSLFGY